MADLRVALQRRFGPMLLALATAACSGGSSSPSPTPTPTPTPTTTVTEKVIGEQGGVVSTDGGVKLTIPIGALDSNTTIRITTTVASAGARPEYKFEPEGQVFAKPITVELPVETGTTAAMVYWADGKGGYEPIGGSVVGSVVRAQVGHFSGGYAGEATTTRTVTGVSVRTNLTSARIYNDPEDISGRTIAAYVARPDGGYDVYPGEGYLNGTFRVPNVPVGPFLLRVGNRYVRTSQDIVDVGQVTPGRRGLASVDLATPITVHYNLANLATWGTTAVGGELGERVDVFSPDVNTWLWGAQGTVASGATRLDNTVNLLAATSKLVPVCALDAALGDRLVVAQQSRASTSTGTSYQAMSRVFESAPISVTTGSSIDLAGDFTDVAQARTISVTWPFGSWEAALLADANPNPGRVIPVNDRFQNRFRVVGQAGGLGYGAHDLAMKADFLAMPVAPGTSTVTSGAMTFGTPLSGTWGVHWLATVDRAVPVSPGYFVISLRTMAAGDGDVVLAAPQLGLPRAPKINGKSLFTAQTGVGLTPTLSWDVSSPGPADGYSVQIVQLTPGGSSPWSYRATLDTAETSIVLPPGILATGSNYLAVIRGYRRGVRVEAPLRIDLPFDLATQVTETFAP